TDQPGGHREARAFDTWTRNCDRYPPDISQRKPNRNNVFLSNEGLPDGQFQLIAMDHTHCFDCGRDLNAHLSRIDLFRTSGCSGYSPNSDPSSDRTGSHCWMPCRSCKRWTGSGYAASQRGFQRNGCGCCRGRALETLVGNRAGYKVENFITLLEAQLQLTRK